MQRYSTTFNHTSLSIDHDGFFGPFQSKTHAVPTPTDKPNDSFKVVRQYVNRTPNPVFIQDRLGLTYAITPELLVNGTVPYFEIQTTYSLNNGSYYALLQAIQNETDFPSSEMSAIASVIAEIKQSVTPTITVTIQYRIPLESLRDGVYHQQADVMLGLYDFSKTYAHPSSHRHVDPSVLVDPARQFGGQDLNISVRYYSKTQKTRYVATFGQIFKLIPNNQDNIPTKDGAYPEEDMLWIYYPRRNLMGEPVKDKTMMVSALTIAQAKKHFGVYDSFEEAAEALDPRSTHDAKLAEMAAATAEIKRESELIKARAERETREHELRQQQVEAVRRSEAEERKQAELRMEEERNRLDFQRKQAEAEAASAKKMADAARAEAEGLRDEERRREEHQIRMTEMRRKDMGEAIKFVAATVAAVIGIVAVVLKFKLGAVVPKAGFA